MASAEANARGARKPDKNGGKNGNGGKGLLAMAFGGSGDSKTVDRGWDECDPRHVLWVLVAVSSLGGAATFGRSRDKSALSVTLLLDGERATTWIAPGEEIETKLTEIAEKLEALA